MTQRISFEEALVHARSLIESASVETDGRNRVRTLLSGFDELLAEQRGATAKPLQEAARAVEPSLVEEIASLKAQVERLRLQDAQDRGLLGTVLTELPHGILVSDTNGKLFLQNRAAERIWAGSATTENVEGWGQYRAFHPDGQPYAPSDWSMERCLSQNITVEAEEVHFQRFDGTHGILLGSCAPLQDPEGTLIGAVGVFADITEFKLVEQLKDRWVALAGDVLREPMDYLRERITAAAIAVAQGQTVDTPELLGALRQRVERLQSLVNDMLDVSRAQAGNLHVELTPVALAPLVSRVADARVRAGARRLLQVELEGVRVLADPARVEQILANLLDNAVAFSAEGPIRIRVRAQENEALIEVEDHGRGFPPEQAPRLFEPFFWLRQEERRPGSLGLGLYLCRELVVRMKGRIWASSPGAGQGACFSFTLPRHRD